MHSVSVRFTTDLSDLLVEKKPTVLIIKLLLSDEIAEMVEELKQYTEEAMKIEMAPWAEGYTVNMEDFYSKLTLEQIENKPTGPISVKLDHYTQLFDAQEATDKRKSFSDEQKTTILRQSGEKKKKILAKGDPGTGKSTLGRIMAYDWAKGEFTAVSVVFFVSMKMVKKGQTIESAIIQQNPPIESLDISEEKLGKILKDLGGRCLIFLDGLDECELQAADDFNKIIEGLNARNIHSPEGYSNPMLLLFLCILANNRVRSE